MLTGAPIAAVERSKAAIGAITFFIIYSIEIPHGQVYATALAHSPGRLPDKRPAQLSNTYTGKALRRPLMLHAYSINRERPYLAGCLFFFTGGRS
jgi:hypothetical protein